MVGVSYDQKPYRRAMIEAWGATIHRSPSELTEAGRSQQANITGSLGIAISEAVELAVANEDVHYSLGSVLGHVCLHQTVIGQECLKQLEMAGEYPDVVIGCVGGGSNFAGVSFPFIRERIRSGRDTRFIAAEPAACPTLTQGRLCLRLRRHDRHDAADADVHARPRLRSASRPRRRPALPRRRVSRVRAGQGRRDRGAGDHAKRTHSPSAVRFGRSEGILPAPEPAHAIKVVIDEALAAKEAGEDRVILFNLCGHGYFDMAAYDQYHRGELEDLEFSEDDMQKALDRLPQAPALA